MGLSKLGLKWMVLMALVALLMLVMQPFKSSSSSSQAGKIPGAGPSLASDGTDSGGLNFAASQPGGGGLVSGFTGNELGGNSLQSLLAGGHSQAPGLLSPLTTVPSGDSTLESPLAAIEPAGGSLHTLTGSHLAPAAIALDVATTAVIVSANVSGLRVNDSAEVRIRCEFRGERHETRWQGKFAGTPTVLQTALVLNSGEDPSVPGHTAEGSASWDNGVLELSLINLDPARFPPSPNDCGTEVRAGPFSQKINLQFIVPPGAPLPLFEIEFCGTIEVINGPALTLNTGAIVIIEPATQIVGDLAVGVSIRVHATEQANGTFLGREIDVIPAQDVARCRA